MSSTNKTTYYDLSQYIGTDKPTYLGDYNSDMSKIDAGIHSAVETATTANQTAGGADAKATKTATDLEALDKRVVANTTNIEQLNANYASVRRDVTGAQNTASQAQQTATSAYNGVQATHFSNANVVTNVNSKITLDSTRPLKVAYSEELNLMILSGGFSLNANIANGEILFTLPSNIKRPSALREIPYFGLSFMEYTAGKGYNYSSLFGVQIDANGNIVQSGQGYQGTNVWCQNPILTNEW